MACNNNNNMFGFQRLNPFQPGSLPEMFGLKPGVVCST
jgi:hypothetical protein